MLGIEIVVHREYRGVVGGVTAGEHDNQHDNRQRRQDAGQSGPRPMPCQHHERHLSTRFATHSAACCTLVVWAIRLRASSANSGGYNAPMVCFNASNPWRFAGVRFRYAKSVSVLELSSALMRHRRNHGR